VADHLDTAAWAHLRGPAIAHARWARTEASTAVSSRVFRVTPSADAVSHAIDDVYRDIADLRTGTGEEPIAPTTARDDAKVQPEG
jgi:hypothetical protein